MPIRIEAQAKKILLQNSIKRKHKNQISRDEIKLKHNTIISVKSLLSTNNNAEREEKFSI